MYDPVTDAALLRQVNKKLEELRALWVMPDETRGRSKQSIMIEQSQLKVLKAKLEKKTTASMLE